MVKSVFSINKSKLRKISYILPIFCLVFWSCGSKKITQQKYGYITGKVFAMSAGSPIPGVLVYCSGISATTDTSGAYSLLNVPVGLRTVSASKVGYQPWSASIDVRRGDNKLHIYLITSMPTANAITFYSQRSGTTQLFAMDSDGSNQQLLTNLVVRVWHGDRGPLWSPDKERIAFVAALEEHGRDLLVISSDGTRLDTLVHGSKVAGLGDWSSDGNQMVYPTAPPLWMPPPLFDIFIIGSDGSYNRQLVPGEQPRFCGNDKVVYTVPGNIYIINTDGTGEDQLTDVPGGEGFPFYSMPVGSPDGQKIAFEVVITGTPYNYCLAIMNSDGTGLRYLVSELDPPGTPEGISEIEFSPDGQKILFLTNDGDNSEIYVINIDATGLYELTGSIACADGGASWSPDGNWIAFTSDREGNKDIYKVSVDGKVLIQLTDDIADDFSPDW